MVLTLAKESKYLRIFLYNKLSWKRLKMELSAYYTCRKSIGKNWRLWSNEVKLIYTAVVRPVVTNGYTVWREATITDT